MAPSAPNGRPAVPERLFCFGLGYTALALGEAARAAGWAVAGTSRSAEKAAALAARGIAAQVFPLADGAALEGATHVLSSVPPAVDGSDPVLSRQGGLLRAARGLVWLGYLSTTAVYGDTSGAWVDEAAPAEPSSERGRRRRAAELGWLALGREIGVPVQIFRLAGIYGPGRSPLDAVRAGRAQRIDKPGHVFSRIHVTDIVQVLRAAMGTPTVGSIYNVCDNEPAPSRAVVEHACALLGIPPPPLVPYAAAELPDMARDFYAESRRVRNGRIKAELGVRLAYPSYREGLAALLDEEPSG